VAARQAKESRLRKAMRLAMQQSQEKAKAFLEQIENGKSETATHRKLQVEQS
jgi:hypothetical protein